MGLVHSAGRESACSSGDPGLIPGLGGSPGEGIGYPLQYSWDSLVAQTVKNNAPTTRETWVQSLGWEDTLEESMATHSNVRAWRIPVDRGVWWAIVHGASKSWMRLSTATKHISFHPGKDGVLLLFLFPLLHHQKQLIVCLFRGLFLYPLGHWKPGEEGPG